MRHRLSLLVGRLTVSLSLICDRHNRSSSQILAQVYAHGDLLTERLCALISSDEHDLTVLAQPVEGTSADAKDVSTSPGISVFL